MMGPRPEAQAALFYEFSLEDHVPQDHLLWSIERHLDLSSIRGHLADFYSHMRRSRRVHPRSHRPKPPETGQAQANNARDEMKERGGRLAIKEIKAVA